MKKVLALALALIMALSMGTMAFADGDPYICPECEAELASATELNTHMKSVHTETDPNACPLCGREFYIEAEYNKHVADCDYNADGSDALPADLKISDILNMIIDLIKTSVDLTKASMSQWDAIESIIIRLVDFVENIGTLAVNEADVKGAVADLEAALAGIEIPGISDLLNALKQKIKDMYAGEVATTVAPTTAAVVIEDTGSSSVGIALFAAVSVAAAAAYVCTKKKD